MKLNNFKINKHLVYGLMVLLSIAMFIVGKGSGAEEFSMATVAVVSLTEAEKTGFSEPEQKMLLAVKKMFSEIEKNAATGAISKEELDQALKGMKDGLTNEEIKSLKDEITKLEGVAKTQGTVIGELQNKLNTTGTIEESALKVLESVKDDIAKVYQAKTGAVEIRMGYQVDKNGKLQLVAKAADVHSTATIGANASITQNISDSAIMRIGSDGDAIETQQRSRPWILDFVSVGSTAASVLTWFDEVPKQGAFAVTAEGAVKPLVMYTFNRTSSDYRKAAGRAKITEEFNNDFPRLVSTIKDLMKTDCRNAMNDLILTDMIANATAYSNAGLALSINNADNWAAIAAAAGQLANTYHTPSVLVLNPNQGIISAAVKDSTGQYVDYSPLMKEIEAGNIKVIRHPSVAMGKFFIGDGSVYKVLLKGDIIVRIGYSNDDFDRNQYSLVVEQFFYSYISQARKSGLIYGDFAAIKTAIETI